VPSVDLTVALFVPVPFPNHYIHRTGAPMVFLGRMKGQYVVQFRQPLGNMAFDMGNSIRITLTLAVEDDDRAQAITDTVIDETKHLPPGLFHRHAVQVQAGLNRILAQTQFLEDAMLNTRTLPAQYILGGQWFHHIRRQRVSILDLLLHRRTLTLKMSRRQFARSGDLRPVGLSNASDVLHLFKKRQAFIFAGHGTNCFPIDEYQNFTTGGIYHKANPCDQNRRVKQVTADTLLADNNNDPAVGTLTNRSGKGMDVTMAAANPENTPQNTRAIMTFLRQHAPFSSMDDAHLAHFAEHSQLSFYADGDVVLSPEDGMVQRFYIVKQGLIRGERLNKDTGRTEPTFEICPGECFPLAALVGERPTRTLHRSAGDTFCLSIDHDAFVTLFSESDPFRDFCLRGVSSLLDQVNKRIQSNAMASIGSSNSLDTPLDRFALRNPIVCTPDMPVRKAVAKMHEADVGSIIITDDSRQPKGIFTLRDLRTMVAEEKAPLDTPISQLMTANPKSLPTTADAFEAAMLMAEFHFAHLVVVDEENRLAGVVSQSDLFSLQRVDLVNLARTIGTAPNLQALVSFRTDVSRLVDTMLAHGADSGQVVKIITTLNDITVRRVIELNLRDNDPGIPFTWLTFGSEGRQEQTLLTDQDNGMLFETPEGMTADEVREKLLPFARKLNDDLAECGFTLCKGNIMASNPKLCLSEEEWDDWFQRFIEASTPQNIVYSSIFLDMRSIFGPEEPLHRLLEKVLERIRKNALFQKMLAANAFERKPPLTMFNNFRYLNDEKRHSLDLKRQGLAPFVEAVRVFALANGVEQGNTLERMEELANKGVFNPKDANAWQEAYSLIQAIRMRAHQEMLNNGEELTNYIDPDDLNPLDRRILRESFRQAQRLQQKLEVTYQL